MMYVTNRDNKERSGPHKRVEKILDNMGIAYMSEYPMPPYILDIFLTEWKLCIEVDGPLHSKKRDSIRDQWLLEARGVHTLRINAKIWQSSQSIQSKILSFIEEHVS